VTLLGRIAALSAVTEVAAWTLATLLEPGSWRYNISALYAAGAPRPWLVMAGEAAFAVGVAALALGLRRSLPPSDHRLVGCALLALASLGTVAGALARNSCEESVPSCKGSTFATTADWVHAVGGLVEILGIAGAALILAKALPGRCATYSMATGCAVFVTLFLWGAVPYPWVGTAERLFALLLVGWVAAIGTRMSPDWQTPRPVPQADATPDRTAAAE
jgi:hypothetical protein